MVLAVDDDHVLGPANDIEIAARHIAHVARVEPAIDQASVRRLLIAEIAAHDRGTSGPHLTNRLFRQDRAIFVPDFHDHILGRLPAIDDGAIARRPVLGTLASGKICFLHQFDDNRSEEHTSELQSLMRISYAVFCLKKNKNKTYTDPIQK